MPKPLQYKPGSLIYALGDDADKVFLLQNGKVSLVYEDIETGNDVRDHLLPGEFFGVRSALGRYPRQENAIVLTNSSVMTLTIPEFEALVMSNTRISMKMLKVFSQQLRRVHFQVSRLLLSEEVKPDEGLFAIGEKYMKGLRYAHAKYIFSRYLTLYPKGPKATQAAKNLQMVASGRTQAKQTAQNAASQEDRSPANDSGMAIDLTAFARFTRVFPQDEIIFSEYEPGDTFYLIQSGRVKLIKNTGEFERTLDILQPVEMFGEMAILENSPRSATAIAMDEVKVLELNSQNFELLMLGNPQLALKLMRIFCKRIYDSRRRFMILTLPNSQSKIADVFLMLDETQANIDKTSDSREFKTTIEDIAHWAGMSVSQAKETLSYFVAQNRLEIAPDRMMVKNINDFSRFVSSRRSQTGIHNSRTKR